jgi:hypothetical protein
MDREVLDYFVVRVLETANRCRDLPTQRELMALANELAEIIEGEQARNRQQTGISRAREAQ